MILTAEHFFGIKWDEPSISKPILDIVGASLFAHSPDNNLDQARHDRVVEALLTREYSQAIGQDSPPVRLEPTEESHIHGLENMGGIPQQRNQENIVPLAQQKGLDFEVRPGIHREKNQMSLLSIQP